MDLCSIKQIKELLSRNGFRFSKSMGQNFLTASWVPERIAEKAGLDAQTGVLEIGPGIGCLTVQLAERAGKVLCVELDNALQPVLGETLAEYGNTEVVYGDALRMDLAELTGQKLAGLRPVVCANIPYNITSPLISALIDSGCFVDMILMVQKEVAKRICAQAGEGDYGAFSVYVGWHAQTEILFDVPPGCFIPQPKVTSSVIRLTPRRHPPAELEDEKLFFRVVRAAFLQRRKTLVNALTAGIGGYSKDDIKQVIISCGYDERIRGETLDIPGFAKVANTLAALG